MTQQEKDNHRFSQILLFIISESWLVFGRAVQLSTISPDLYKWDTPCHVTASYSINKK